jgi:hypothetical protein
VRPLAAAAAAACALALGACGDTLQTVPIAHNSLEGMIVTPFPVYWLGGTFDGLAISEATHDPSGGFSIQYGNCVQGGQSTCVTPLRVVTSPNNSFVPGGAAPGRIVTLRGVRARLAADGSIVIVPAGPVVVGIYAQTRRIALAAADTVVPINALGSPGQPLAPPVPDTGFGSVPLQGQAPAPLAPLPHPRPARKAPVRRGARRGARRSSSG